jgi:plasmid stabilization system protein ParE
MSRYQFTPQASDDLIDIYNFIAQDNREAAGQVEAAVFQACDFLAHSPRAGKVRKDVTSLPLRFWAAHPYSNYLIVYEPDSKPLRIIRILHGARDLSAILR